MPDQTATQDPIVATKGGRSITNTELLAALDLAHLVHEIVEVVYTKDIDDPDTVEQSRTVVAAFADPELAEAVHGHLVPGHRNVRIMVTGVKPPAGFQAGEDPAPA